MRLVWGYLIPRLIQWVVVVVIGTTAAFLIPRLLPLDPVEQTIRSFTATSVTDPASVQELNEAVTELYGLQGSLFDQYLTFWRRLFTADLGPSMSAFPTPVSTMIRNALPWTAGLLGTAILVSWVLGICLGTLAAYRPRSVWTKALTAGLVTVYPIPYFILGLILLIVFAFYVPIFPLSGGASEAAAWSLSYLGSLAYHAALPLLSLVLLGTAFRFILARAIAGTVVSSDYVNFAEISGLPKRTVIVHYVMRNTLMPQVTDLALSIGAIFEGALITEIIFSYPGLGYLLYTGILRGDYNLILGVTLFSIIGVATATLVLDFIYPLVDPRVRYG